MYVYLGALRHLEKGSFRVMSYEPITWPSCLSTSIASKIKIESAPGHGTLIQCHTKGKIREWRYPI